MTIPMITRDHILSTLRSTKPQLAQLGIRNVGLFGSYAKGGGNTASDIDILIEFEPNRESFDNFMQVCDMFENLFINEKVEVVTKNGLSPFIGPRILKEVVYA